MLIRYKEEGTKFFSHLRGVGGKKHLNVGLAIYQISSNY